MQLLTEEVMIFRLNHLTRFGCYHILIIYLYTTGLNEDKCDKLVNIVLIFFGLVDYFHIILYKLCVQNHALSPTYKCQKNQFYCSLISICQICFSWNKIRVFFSYIWTVWPRQHFGGAKKWHRHKVSLSVSCCGCGVIDALLLIDRDREVIVFVTSI